MQKGYRGSLVILGDAKIKPYDICYIFDEYTEMYGPVEVEQVVHKFSPQSGFITEIIPKMCVHVNESATLHSLDVMGLVAEDYLGKFGKQFLSLDFMPDTGLGDFIEGFGTVVAGTLAVVAGTVIAGATFGAGLAVLSIGMSAYFFTDNLLLDDGDQYHNGRGLGALDAVGMFLFRKMITRTQMQHLFEYSPLTVRGRPLLGGLPLFKKPYGPGSFIKNIQEEFNIWYTEGVEGEALLNLEEDMNTRSELYNDK